MNPKLIKIQYREITNEVTNRLWSKAGLGGDFYSRSAH